MRRRPRLEIVSILLRVSPLRKRTNGLGSALATGPNRPPVDKPGGRDAVRVNLSATNPGALRYCGSFSL
jgi:hypothetical protein